MVQKVSCFASFEPFCLRIVPVPRRRPQQQEHPCSAQARHERTCQTEGPRSTAAQTHEARSSKIKQDQALDQKT